MVGKEMGLVQVLAMEMLGMLSSWKVCFPFCLFTLFLYICYILIRLCANRCLSGWWLYIITMEFSNHYVLSYESFGISSYVFQIIRVSVAISSFLCFLLRATLAVNLYFFLYTLSIYWYKFLFLLSDFFPVDNSVSSLLSTSLLYPSLFLPLIPSLLGQ